MPLDLSGDAATPKPRLSPASPSFGSGLALGAATSTQPAPYDADAVAKARAELSALLKLGAEAQPGIAGGAPPSYITERAGIAGAQERYQADIDSAQKALDEALAARRDQALTVPGERPENPDAKPKPGNIAKRTEPMTWEAYSALSPLQRSAVDYNTSLVRAVRRDRQLQNDYEPGEQQREVYDKAVEKLFGEDRGSVMYAPETVALLQQIDLKDSMADLDDFLGLKAAITAKDLKGLTDYTLPTAIRGESVETDREDMVRQIATNNSAMQEKLVQGNEMLQSMRATSIRDRNEYVANLGGIPKAAPTMLGYGSPTQIDTEGRTATTMDGHFQRAFDLLARKGSDRDVLLAQLADGAQPGQMEAFMRYVDARSMNSTQYGIDLGGEEGAKYLTPEEFRVKLGLETKAVPNG